MSSKQKKNFFLIDCLGIFRIEFATQIYTLNRLFAQTQVNIQQHVMPLCMSLYVQPVVGIEKVTETQHITIAIKLLDAAVQTTTTRGASVTRRQGGHLALLAISFGIYNWYCLQNCSFCCVSSCLQKNILLLKPNIINIAYIACLIFTETVIEILYLLLN